MCICSDNFCGLCSVQMEKKKIESVNIGGTHNIINGTLLQQDLGVCMTLVSLCSLCGVWSDSISVYQHVQCGVWWTGDQRRR